MISLKAKYKHKNIYKNRIIKKKMKGDKYDANVLHGNRQLEKEIESNTSKSTVINWLKKFTTGPYNTRNIKKIGYATKKKTCIPA